MACRASYAKTFWRYKVNESKEGGPPCKCLATGLCFSLSAQGAPQFFEAMGGAAVFSPSRRPLFYSRNRSLPWRVNQHPLGYPSRPSHFVGFL